jgi:DNA-binding response OmpR family regulator
VSVLAITYFSEGEAPGSGRRDAGPRGARRLAPVPGAEGGAGAEARGLTALVVEDDPAMRLLCTYNLELSGFRVVSASSGSAGVALAGSEPFDVVLLDVMLPDLGGFEVAERLQADETTRDLPIVFMSARISDVDIARGRAVGAIDYVTKPFDPVALTDRLRENLDELDRGGPEHVRALRFASQEEERRDG